MVEAGSWVLHISLLVVVLVNRALVGLWTSHHSFYCMGGEDIILVVRVEGLYSLALTYAGHH